MCANSSESLQYMYMDYHHRNSVNNEPQPAPMVTGRNQHTTWSNFFLCARSFHIWLTHFSRSHTNVCGARRGKIRRADESVLVHSHSTQVRGREMGKSDTHAMPSILTNARARTCYLICNRSETIWSDQYGMSEKKCVCVCMEHTNERARVHADRLLREMNLTT